MEADLEGTPFGRYRFVELLDTGEVVDIGSDIAPTYCARNP